MFQGSVGKSFSFASDFYENQSKFPTYIDSFIRKSSVVPGQGYSKPFGAQSVDFANASAAFSYQLSPYVGVQVGHGKNFIGDGYRSMLLSDVAFNYPFLKITTDIWKIKYIMLWTEFQNISLTKKEDRFAWEKKNGVFHFLDVQLTDKLAIGLFEGVIWLPQDSTVNRGIEWNYLNPLIFLRPVEFSLGSPDNVVLGINTSYRFSNSIMSYGQFLIDELTVNEFFSNKGYWGNKYGIQVGLKSYDAFTISELYIQCELNTVTPYTYSHKDPSKNYGHYNQELAHPLGANFIESIGIANYSHKQYDFRFQFKYQDIK